MGRGVAGVAYKVVAVTLLYTECINVYVNSECFVSIVMCEFLVTSECLCM